MNFFGITQDTDTEAARLTLKSFGLNLEDFKNKKAPQEDAFLISEKYPIFVVADGVTLIQHLFDKSFYPDPSPAGLAAKTFCQEVVKEAETEYENWSSQSLQKIFKAGNKAVEKFNAENGRTKENSDFWHNDLFACTVALVVIKDKTVYWGSVCDSYVVCLNQGKIKFKSPLCHSLKEAEAAPFLGDQKNLVERTKFVWQFRRNALNEKGQRIGYGVVTGEDSVENYLNQGSFSINTGDQVAILTDGFEKYLSSPDFLQLLAEWPDDLVDKLKQLSGDLIASSPEAYGHERTIIVTAPAE